MDTLVESLKEVSSDELRIVATLKNVDYELEYVRSDLEDEYSQAELERAYQSIVANQVSSADFAQVGAFGELDAQIFFFEEIIVFLFPTSRYSGVFVSYERTDTVDQFPIRDVITTVNDHPDIPEGP